MGQEETFREMEVKSNDLVVRKISLSDLWQALREGFNDFQAKPTHIVFLCVVYPLFALLLTLFLVGERLVYLAFPVVSGFTLIGPVVSVALFEMSRRREHGLDVTWRAAFDFVHTYSFAPILALSIVMMLLYVAWLYMAELLYFGLFGAGPPVSISAFVNEVFTTRHGWALIFYGTILGFIFALVTLSISVFAFPLLLDRPVSSITAVTTSIRAVAANPLTMAVWGIIVVGLLAIGSVLFLIGLAVVLPVLGHSTWHLYRKVVVEP